MIYQRLGIDYFIIKTSRKYIKKLFKLKIHTRIVRYENYLHKKIINTTRI